MSNRNLLAHMDAIALVAAGKTTAADASSVALTCPLEFAGDIVLVKTGTGVYTITINPFRGQQGNVNTVVSLTGASGIARVDSETYTGDSLVITVKTFAVDGTSAADKAFSFISVAV